MELLKTFVLPNHWVWNKKEFRESCRAVVFDDDGLIPLIFVSKRNYHKLPGWWIEPNEDKIEALKREFLEETGCEIEITTEIWMVIETNPIRDHKSYCYIGQVISKWEASLTHDESFRWHQLKWRTIDEAIFLLENDIPIDRHWDRIIERDLFILKKAKELC